jgi:chromosome segregation ATPase
MMDEEIPMVNISEAKPVRRFALSLTFIVVAALGGCSSSTQGEKMVQSYSKTRETLADARNEVAITLISMNRLRDVNGDDALKRAFTQYKEAVARLEKQAGEAKTRASAMKEESDEHVRKWQKEMASIKDPEMKASLEDRRRAVQSNFATVRMYADDVRGAYEPFLRGNKDLLRALSIDLSPAAIASLSPSMDKLNADGRKLQERIGAMQQALNNIANGEAPLGEM